MDKIIKFNQTDNIDFSEDKKDIPKIEIEEIEPIFNELQETDRIDDYKFSRKKLINTIHTSETILKSAVENIKPSDPRSLEAVSTIIKAISDCSNQLLTLHKELSKMNPPESNTSETKNGETTIKACVTDILDNME